MLNSTRIDLATDEDRFCGLDHWAALFKATTWEDLKMLAKQDELISEASATIYQLTQEEKIRLQCEAREDYYRRQRSVQHMLEDQKNTIKDQAKTIQNQDAAIRQLTDNNTSLLDENASLKGQLASALKQLNSQ